MTAAPAAQEAFSARLADWTARALPPLAVLAALFVAWEVYVELSGINPVTLPGPSRILDAAITHHATLLDHTLVTLQETLIGLAVSIVLGVALALLIDLFAPVRRAVYPLLVGSQTVPIVVLAPLLILWFGFELTPKIIVVTLYTFFPITVSLAAGLAATDREALLLMHTLGAGRLRTLHVLRLPQSLPYFFTGLRIAVTYAMVAAVFAEWAGAREGLGIYVLLMKNSFRTDLVFAAVFLIAALSLLLFALTSLIERIVVRWR
jgi:ABC-type nitrate/sulfonate/bicarbonate transport system permease component